MSAFFVWIRESMRKKPRQCRPCILYYWTQDITRNLSLSPSVLRIRCLFDPLDPGSRIRNVFLRIPDLGSRTPKPYFLEISNNFWVKSSIIFFYSISKIKLFSILWNLWLQKRYDPDKFFFHPSLLLLFLDPGYGMRDPVSGIWDKHPGSAPLASSLMLYDGWKYLGKARTKCKTT